MPALSWTEEAVVSSITAADVVDRLVELVALPSEGGRPAEATIQHLGADRLDGLGFDVDLWPLDLPALRADPDHPGEEADRDEAWGLVATYPAATGGAAEPALVLASHIDVVPPGDLRAWSGDPYRARVGAKAVTGRGTCDMKGGAAASLVAAEALRRNGVELVRPYAMHLLVGEEDGGLGAFATLRRGHRGAACVIPEPTGLQLVTANAGSLSFRIDVPGLATHGSTPYAGSSALDSYVAIHTALQGLQRRRNQQPEPLMAGFPVPYPLSVGRVRTGDWASSVPDRLIAEGRYGLRIEEDPETARREFEDVVAQVASRDPYLRDHPPRVSWTGGQFRGGALFPSEAPGTTPERRSAALALRDGVAVAHGDLTGVPPAPERGAPWGSDLRLYTGSGVPTLHYGPGDVRLAHGPDESVPIDQLLTAARVLALLILRACAPPQ